MINTNIIESYSQVSMLRSEPWSHTILAYLEMKIYKVIFWRTYQYTKQVQSTMQRWVNECTVQKKKQKKNVLASDRCNRFREDGYPNVIKKAAPRFKGINGLSACGNSTEWGRLWAYVPNTNYMYKQPAAGNDPVECYTHSSHTLGYLQLHTTHNTAHIMT